MGATKTRTSKARYLSRLYRDIYECERCIQDPTCEMRPDDRRVLRRVISRSVTSPLFIVGQALGPETQRRSGLPYTYTNGTLSPTGRALDQFLRMIGFSIDVEGDLPYPYSSDIVQRYPGRAPGGGGDRRPNPVEVANCADWLEAELRLVQPKIVLLLGKPAARSFLRRYAGDNSLAWGLGRDVHHEEWRATAFPVYHPAYRRRNPSVVDALYRSVARKIRRLLAKAT